MNRRSLLRSLAALSFAGSSFAAVTSLNAEITEPAGRENSISELLSLSRQMCRQLCRDLSSSTAAHASAKDLMGLIEEAQTRLQESRPHAAAFWQACSDAFIRTAEQLDQVKSQSLGARVSISEIQHTFLRTAISLNQQTSTTISSVFARGTVIA
jgi:prophage DNA circulation protein